jgi:hypothetical protein
LVGEKSFRFDVVGGVLSASCKALSSICCPILQQAPWREENNNQGARFYRILKIADSLFMDEK